MPSSDTATVVNSETIESDAVKSEEANGAAQAQSQKWPGWPGDNVFRLVVPMAKVGSIIGRKGELVKKMSDETRARIRVLDGPSTNPDRIVLISGKEEPDAPLSPAMDAALRVFKRVSGLSSAEGVGTVPASALCSTRLVVASSQAINLIGKQGSTIKSIQETTGASVRILTEGELPSYATKDERIVEVQGEASKVLKALEAVIGQLRKFLVDHSVVPVFEQNHNAAVSKDQSADSLPDISQPRFLSASAPQTGITSDYSLSLKRDPSLYDPEAHIDPQISQSRLPIYGQESRLGVLRSMGLGRANTPIVTQMIQTMQVPLSYAEDIIGVGGSNIAYIRRSSGAILTIQESRGFTDEITVEIKGTSSQVQLAQHLIQEVISTHKEPAASAYGKIDAGLGAAYSHVTDTSYPPPSLGSHLGGYGASNVGRHGSPGGGGYNSYRF